MLAKPRIGGTWQLTDAGAGRDRLVADVAATLALGAAGSRGSVTIRSDPLATMVARIGAAWRIVVPFAPVQFAIAARTGGAENGTPQATEDVHQAFAQVLAGNVVVAAAAASRSATASRLTATGRFIATRGFASAAWLASGAAAAADARAELKRLVAAVALIDLPGVACAASAATDIATTTGCPTVGFGGTSAGVHGSAHAAASGATIDLAPDRQASDKRQQKGKRCTLARHILGPSDREKEQVCSVAKRARRSPLDEYFVVCIVMAPRDDP